MKQSQDLFITGVEGFDFFQPFRGALGMATKPVISVSFMNKDLAIPTCVCVTMWFLQAPCWPPGTARSATTPEQYDHKHKERILWNEIEKAKSKSQPYYKEKCKGVHCLIGHPLKVPSRSLIQNQKDLKGQSKTMAHVIFSHEEENKRKLSRSQRLLSLLRKRGRQLQSIFHLVRVSL